MDTFGADLGYVLAKAAMPLGYLRLASAKYKLNLSFKDLQFNAFVRSDPARIEERELVREVLTRNPRCSHVAKDLHRMMASVAQANHDCWHVAYGHDMTAALAVLLTAKKRRDVTSYTIERQLRLAYHPTDFAATALFTAIKAWEQRNAPYRVLRRVA